MCDQRSKTCALITRILISYGYDPGFSTELPANFRDENEVIHFVFIALDSRGLDHELLPPETIEKIEHSAHCIAQK